MRYKHFRMQDKYIHPIAIAVITITILAALFLRDNGSAGDIAVNRANSAASAAISSANAIMSSNGMAISSARAVISERYVRVGKIDSSATTTHKAITNDTINFRVADSVFYSIIDTGR